jgi:hypothetical protein
VCSSLGGKFYLMCQSFGHHVLNAFLKKYKTQRSCFEKVFLMAADIPNQALNSAPEVGVRVKNKIGFGGDYTHLNLTPLIQLCKEIHVFYDPYDIILAASRKNFLMDYERLGKTGPHGGTTDPKIIVHNYNEYKDGMFLGAEVKLDNILLKVTRRSQKQYNRRHQYFYSNPSVVEIIKFFL